MSNRPIASLTPTLLARKGAARPAMRPQLQPLRAFQDNAARQLDDLGWNDMGADADKTADTAAQIAAEMPAEEQFAPVDHLPVEHQAEIVVLNPAAADHAPRLPEIVHQQEQIPERMVQLPRKSALSEGRRAAFTLRLDAERHLKLRLASVTMGRSAQQLVTEALDRLIAELPDVAELAATVGKKRR